MKKVISKRDDFIVDVLFYFEPMQRFETASSGERSQNDQSKSAEVGNNVPDSKVRDRSHHPTPFSDATDCLIKTLSLISATVLSIPWRSALKSENNLHNG